MKTPTLLAVIPRGRLPAALLCWVLIATALAGVAACTSASGSSTGGAEPEPSLAQAQSVPEEAADDPEPLAGTASGITDETADDPPATPQARIGAAPRAEPEGGPHLSWNRSADTFANLADSEVRFRPGAVRARDEFGWSVATDGLTIVGGAPLHDAPNPEVGAAYVYELRGGEWYLTASLLPAGREPGAWFGRWVDVDGSVIAVGAPLSDVKTDEDDAGAAYIFRRRDGVWRQEAKLIAPDAGGSDQFGWSVSVSGDTVAVGAWSDNHAGEDSGSVYIFRFNGRAWEQEAFLTAGDPGEGDLFGGQIALDGDTLIVSATGDDVAGNNSGAVYVFDRDGDEWEQTAKIKPRGLDPEDEFGRALSISGDRIAVGVPYDDDLSFNSGAVYVYRRINGHWLQHAKIVAQGLDVSDWFGYSVGIDGYTVVAGAPHVLQTSTGIVRAGKVYVFQQISNRWRQVSDFFTGSSEQAGARADFGWAADLRGNTIAIGAWTADTPAGVDAGAVYAFLIPNVE